MLRVAQNRLVDAYRSELARRRREEVVGVAPAPGDVLDGDDTLLLLILCCSPALTPASAVALTLRAVGGLTTAQIAAAFLVPEATMAQRISRVKQRLRQQAEPFAPPPPDELPRRLRLVLHVLYLIFNEGYTSSGGDDLHRVELSAEAVRLARLLQGPVAGGGPADGEVAGEVTGLLALMLLTDARRPARTGPGGVLIPLDEQDRSRWDRALVAEGVALAAPAMCGEIEPHDARFSTVAHESSSAMRAFRSCSRSAGSRTQLIDTCASNPRLAVCGYRQLRSSPTREGSDFCR